MTSEDIKHQLIIIVTLTVTPGHQGNGLRGAESLLAPHVLIGDSVFRQIKPELMYLHKAQQKISVSGLTVDDLIIIIIHKFSIVLFRSPLSELNALVHIHTYIIYYIYIY